MGPTRGAVVRRKGAGLGTRGELKQQALVPVCKKTGRTKPTRARVKQDGSERSRPQPEVRPILDARIPGLLSDSLTSVQAAIMSASKGLPYKALRQAMAIGEEEKHELTSAAQAAVAKYPAFFAEHKDAVEVVTVLMAINAAHMDHMFSLLGQSDGSPALAQPGPLGEHVCSAREALGMALIVLAPLGLLALVLLIQHWRRN
jgi:hypothetical protein